MLDVCDLSWSPDSTELISGSVDNVMFKWILEKGQKDEVKRHEHYVQGVAWSPCGQLMASQSSDRTCSVLKLDMTCHGKSMSGWDEISLLSKSPTGKQMFCDEDCPTFFRRLTFSPEGSLLFCPTGSSSDEKAVFGQTNDAPAHCAYVVSSQNPSAPALQLPGFKKPVVSVRCCPLLFENMEDATPIFDLPYRIVYAIASQDAVTIYDTQHEFPIATVTGLHYHHITDICWTNHGEKDDSAGMALAISSADGYCSFVNFSAGELGTVLEESKVPLVMRRNVTSLAVADANTKASVTQPVVKTLTVKRKSDKLAGGSLPPQQTPDCISKAEISDGSLEKKEKKRRIVPDLVGGSQSDVITIEDSPVPYEKETPVHKVQVKEARRITPQVETTDISGKKRIAPALVQ